MRTFESLNVGDYVAFYDVSEGVVVSNISFRNEKTVTVHYIYDGYKSTSQTLSEDKIFAIGNNDSGEGEISGWSGRYDIINPKGLEEALKK